MSAFILLFERKGAYKSSFVPTAVELQTEDCESGIVILL